MRQVALDPAHARRLRVFALRFLQPQAVLGREAVQSPPAVASGDDGGLDEPLLPAVRRAHGARARPSSGEAVSADVGVGFDGLEVPDLQALGAGGQGIVQGAHGSRVVEQRGLRDAGCGLRAAGFAAPFGAVRQRTSQVRAQTRCQPG